MMIELYGYDNFKRFWTRCNLEKSLESSKKPFRDKIQLFIRIYSFFKIKNWQYVFSKGKCDWGYLHTVHKNNWLELIINNLLCHFMKSLLALKTKKCVLCIKQSLHIVLCILSITQPNLCIIKQKWTILSFHTFYVLYRTINVGWGWFFFIMG